MKEGEYIELSNRINIRNARAMLSNVVSGDEFGIDSVKFSEVKNYLAVLEGELYKKPLVNEGDGS